MLIDTHAHLDDPGFRADIPGLLSRAKSAGLVHVVAVATTAVSSESCIQLAHQYPDFISASAGIHPNHMAQSQSSDWDRILELSKITGVRAIGETGLDRHWDDTPFPQQEEYFRRHLTLGRELHLPVIIHCREAEVDMLRVLREEFDRHGPIHAVMHSFVGDQAMAKACLEMGLYLSYAGMLTFKNAESLRITAATLPPDRVMVETDSPYLTPVPFRSKRNEPAMVKHTAECLGGLLGYSLAEIGNITTQNARTFFKIP